MFLFISTGFRNLFVVNFATTLAFGALKPDAFAAASFYVYLFTLQILFWLFEHVITIKYIQRLLNSIK